MLSKGLRPALLVILVVAVAALLTAMLGPRLVRAGDTSDLTLQQKIANKQALQGAFLQRMADSDAPASSKVAGPNPSLCGPWESPSGDVGAYFAVRSGAVRSCALFGRTWVLTTTANRSSHTTGVLAVDECQAGDASCMNGMDDHPTSAWLVHSPPYPGDVGVLAAPSSTLLIIDDAGHQMCFDLNTDTFDTDPSCQ